MKYNIDDFAAQLVKDKGITGLSHEIMDQLRSDLVERAENIIIAEMVHNMPKDKLADFEKKIDEGNDSEIQEFCSKHIKNLDEVVAGALLKLRNMYLANVLN